MKFTAHLERQLRPLPEKRAPGEAMRERLEKKREREQRLSAQVEAARAEHLCEADQMLARTIRLPEARVERVAMAAELRQVGDRQRTYRQIAAIMGLSRHVIHAYFQDPEGKFEHQKAYDARTRRAPKVNGSKPEPEPEPEPTPEPVRSEINGEWIKRRRKGLNISQAHLARMLGISPMKVRAWERDEEHPTPGYVSQLRQILL